MFKLLSIMTHFADLGPVTPAEKDFLESAKSRKEVNRPPWTATPHPAPKEESVHDALVEGVEEAAKELGKAIEGK